MNTADLQFNLIYTPNTVKWLLPFMHSLLKWTDCRYQIVCNGCDLNEQGLLKDFCVEHDRVDYLAASEDKLIEHGLALDWLQERNQSDWFCFIDTDIIVTGPYLTDVVEHMKTCDVFTSGHPLWYAQEDIELPPSFQRWLGSCFQTTDGKTLGGTYFAVYDNAKLSETMRETGVGFRFQRWDEVSEPNRQALRKIGLDKFDYDTGKLLMALMYARGVRFHAEDLPHIRHLGGFSSLAGNEPAYYYRGYLDQFACRFLGGALAALLLKFADTWYGWRRTAKGMTPAQSKQLSMTERRVLQSRERKRLNTARYFAKLMHNLTTNQPAPEIPVMGFAPAEQRLAETTKDVRALYESLNQ